MVRLLRLTTTDRRQAAFFVTLYNGREFTTRPESCNGHTKDHLDGCDDRFAGWLDLHRATARAHYCGLGEIVLPGPGICHTVIRLQIFRVNS